MKFPLAIALSALFCLTGMAQVRITEFMASNTRTLTDQDQATSDWIELQNTTTNTLNLLNWALTDSASNPGKWRFPATNLPPKSFLIVFASGKNRAVTGQELHTNFKLGSEGEYLALFRPDGAAMSEISQYPSQFPGVSYGLGMQTTVTTLVASNSAIRYSIPTNSAVDALWFQVNFDDSKWFSGLNGIGYETDIADPQEESFAAKVLASQPVVFWRMNETNGLTALNLGSGGVSDQGGYVGGILLSNAGPRPLTFPCFESNNFAPLCDGTSGYVAGPYELMNNLPAFTIGGWIYPTGKQSSRTALFGQNDTIEFGFNSSSTIQAWTPYGSLSVNYPFSSNQWHHVMAVGGNDQLMIYIDGTNVGTTSISSANFGESEYNFNVGGAVWDGSGNFFKGQLDEVAVWFRALATNEIAALLATNAEQLSYASYLATDVRAQMYRSNSTAYVRLPFTVVDTNAFDSLKLLLRYDDGFVAYLNGHLIASANAPASPTWNSSATQRHLDPQAVQWSEFDVSAARGWLQSGKNVLAIRALNINSTNTDFLMQAQLVGQSISDTAAGWRFFTGATPGLPNGTSTNDSGPVMSQASHVPNVPSVGDALTVTAQVTPGFNAISSVTLHYRVMFNAEVSLPMSLTSVSGTWTAVIPGGAASAGQLLRYYVTAADSANNQSRWPLFPDATDSQQYYGTVVADPSIRSQLAVASLFIQNPSGADNQTGTQGSLFYLNELYDNLNIYVHGQSSAGWTKKSHNLAFPKDHQFLYQTNGAREGKIIFISNYGDKARMHTTLTYATAALSGGASLFSFPIRIQLNGSFWGIEDMVEHGDEAWLDRIGLDASGALYKMYNSLTGASGNEKKTREWEGTDDLSALVNSLDEALPLTNRVTYAYDKLDLPQAANYFAEMALASSQDLLAKNYYLYCDSEGTGEWSITPWDVDLTWGRNWTDGSGYFTDTIYTNNVLNFDNPQQQYKSPNRFFDLMFASTDFRQMYLRRLRTLMDTVLMAPGTPTNRLVIEPIIRKLESVMNPPAISPSDAALDYAAWGPTWGTASFSVFPADAERLISTYLPGRREFLFHSPAATLNGDSIPALQPTNTMMQIASWDYSPVSGNQNEQYVELRNTNSYAVDLSGWRIIGSIEFTVRPGTVVPAGKSLYVVANVNAFRARATSPHAGENRFVQGPFASFLSTQGTSPLILENAAGALVSKNSYAGNSGPVQLAAGNLAVLRVGDGAQSLGSHGNSVFIDQFTTSGTLVGSLHLPDSDTNALITSGSASSEGALTRSADGRLLVLAGYNLPLTTAATLGSSLANATAAVAPRAVGVLDASGNFALVAVTTNQYGGNNMRAATTDGQGNYWGAGALGGTFYFGSGPTNTLQTTVANTVVIQDLGDNLFFSTAKSTPGIWKIPGTPRSPTTASLFLGTGAGSSSFSFAFNAGFTVAYIADDTLAGKGGIQRWDNNGGAWTMAYAFTSLTSVGARGLAADFSSAHPVLYATTAENANNRLVSIVDLGAASPATTLATSGANQIFRGVAFTPMTSTNPKIFSAVKNPNGLALTWTALLNQNYTVQWTDDLSKKNWITLTNLTSTLPTMVVQDPGAPAATNRFYRVILNP